MRVDKHYLVHNVFGFRRPDAYIHTHVRSADIPLNYNSRASWTAFFELLAYLVTCLKEQRLLLGNRHPRKYWPSSRR
ncbi:uncharacterized protein BYT42DRAFT_620873 [Radiomyces spectabilis]|uniref:uncharacterized protein n=1 Tax=Radiomyces spectabilis TaxID=64574 RepID=UPI002220EDC9|nr:uncharacterized protein BYT42DRAFT_620873 [Radiomyces spectabilis]KAI8394311.1 hypothetical protein BYT42DRAFT_620873 [Radiomyces spectabilis]